MTKYCPKCYKAVIQQVNKDYYCPSCHHRFREEPQVVAYNYTIMKEENDKYK
jgi:Zn finger protein HypA/HybF involved in hydrogenase expression